jgi:hypothetical protein
MKAHGVSGTDLELVHYPEATVVDEAHVHFEFFRQFLGVDQLFGNRKVMPNGMKRDFMMVA